MQAAQARPLGAPECACIFRAPMCRVRPLSRAVVAPAVARGSPVRVSRAPVSGAKPTSVIEPSLYAVEEVLGAEVEVLAPGAVDAGLFEADLSAQALVDELEAVSAQLAQALDALPAVGAADLGLAGWSDGGVGGDMQRGDDGMYTPLPADQARLKQVVDISREERKEKERREKAEKREKRDARLRAQKRLEARAARQAQDAAAAAPSGSDSGAGSSSSSGAATGNRGGPAGPGPASVSTSEALAAATARAAQRARTSAAAPAPSATAAAVAAPGVSGAPQATAPVPAPPAVDGPPAAAAAGVTGLAVASTAAPPLDQS
ncbi:hypothetical protein MNEG_14860 [Monoraphidium neglectum]|uniref:Uncharacterized protein n=1 Tax=Monoraphidium neglectum TaxID=145388 RepID=A0A0D2KAV9_9CHLO|nr:hypothetical protein MNEG_14860 [Monoraphidium neglectum]KIY93103.1 hypothetical protein MNEG_14860 [Monoraphidium neglectum]|eukprot:XP_013892123.1 hypothetical protein MNEG_14860 [Monoraphidium neglectum]